MQFGKNVSPKPLYRTIQECHDELLRRDKDCKISVNFIRTLCRQNKIEYLANGAKSIVNLTSLLAFLGFSEVETQAPSYAEHGTKNSASNLCDDV